MKIIIDRQFPTPNYIIGKVFIDDAYFCDSLELPYIDNRPNISCVQKGEYLIHIRWSNNFKMWLPQLQDVPKRSDILIHPANFVNADGKTDEANEYDQLNGCIALGKNRVKGQVLDSRIWQEKLMTMIRAAVSGNEPIVIKII